MTERDLQRILNQSVQDVHLSDAARRRIRQATKEERPVTSKKFVAIVLAVVLALTASVGIAAELGMFDFLARKMGQTVLPGAYDLLKSDIAYGETDHVTYTVKQAVYDGKSVAIMVDFKPKTEGAMLVSNLSMPNNPSDIASSAIYVEMLTSPLRDSMCIDEWHDGTLTMLLSFFSTDKELPVELAITTYPYMADGTVPLSTTTSQITLQAVEPLWTVSSEETFDAPGFGIRVDGVSVIGTPVQCYFDIRYTVTDAEKASTLPWNADLLDVNKDYLPRGMLGVGGSSSPNENGQQLVYTGAFGATEQAPKELLLVLRNWDNFDLNNYFPINLK